MVEAEAEEKCSANETPFAQDEDSGPGFSFCFHALQAREVDEKSGISDFSPLPSPCFPLPSNQLFQASSRIEVVTPPPQPSSPSQQDSPLFRRLFNEVKEAAVEPISDEVAAWIASVERQRLREEEREREREGSSPSRPFARWNLGYFEPGPEPKILDQDQEHDQDRSSDSSFVNLGASGQSFEYDFLSNLHSNTGA
jgi:hypothetical protein